MKIAITTVQIPFVKGGAEFLAQNLKTALLNAGHEAEIVSMPFIDAPHYRIEDHIIASRLMDVEWSWGGHIDLCIGLKFPAYYMPHPNKVVWALHQHRQAFDLFNTDFSTIKDDVEGRAIRDMITRADKEYLMEAKRRYTISQNVTNRMEKFTGIDSKCLYHPAPDMEKFYAGEYGDYIIMPSRINPTKRQHLAIEAMAKTKQNFKLYIVGGADNPAVKQELVDKIKKYKVEDKIVLYDFVSQEEKMALYSKSKAVLFIPKDEDYGYITLEGMAASKAVITAKDSGGPMEFILQDKTGIVADPTPDELARAMDYFIENKKAAEDMGKAAKQHLIDLDITWDSVVKELTR